MKRALLVVLLCCCLAIPLQAADYHYRVLDNMTGGNLSLYQISAVSDSGRIFGFGWDNESMCNSAVTWSSQTGFSALPSPVSYYDYGVCDANRSGQAVGTASYTSPECPNWNYSAIRWTSDGTASSLTVPGYQNAQAYAINNLGWVVGFASDGLSGSPIMWNPYGIAITLDGLRVANDINDNGDIVGWSGDGANGQDMWATIRHPNGTTQILCHGEAFKISNSGNVIGSSFFWSSKTGVIDISIDLPYIDGFCLSDVNDRGEVVGFYRVWEPMFDEPYPFEWVPNEYAFVWTADSGIVNLGKMSGLEASNAFCIDDSGRIYGTSSDGLVMWEPVTTPECTSILSLMVGLGGLGLRFKRGRI
ncbi:DUF3466 family protein [bacterium]|nr:DUF3466 family protein [bacterium]